MKQFVQSSLLLDYLSFLGQILGNFKAARNKVSEWCKTCKIVCFMRFDFALLRLVTGLNIFAPFSQTQDWQSSLARTRFPRFVPTCFSFEFWSANKIRREMKRDSSSILSLDDSECLEENKRFSAIYRYILFPGEYKYRIRLSLGTSRGLTLLHEIFATG